MFRRRRAHSPLGMCVDRGRSSLSTAAQQLLQKWMVLFTLPRWLYGPDTLMDAFVTVAYCSLLFYFALNHSRCECASPSTTNLATGMGGTQNGANQMGVMVGYTTRVKAYIEPGFQSDAFGVPIGFQEQHCHSPHRDLPTSFELPSSSGVQSLCYLRLGPCSCLDACYVETGRVMRCIHSMGKHLPSRQLTPGGRGLVQFYHALVHQHKAISPSRLGAFLGGSHDIHIVGLGMRDDANSKYVFGGGNSALAKTGILDMGRASSGR